MTTSNIEQANGVVATGTTSLKRSTSSIDDRVGITVKQLSPLHQDRLNYFPRCPPLLRGAFRVRENPVTLSEQVDPRIESLFPTLWGQSPVKITPNSGGAVTMGHKLRIAVVLSGGPAPGGHNVISGLFDHLHDINSESQLFGFLDGPSGIINGEYIELTEDVVYPYRNQGGFHMIGSGRTKIETPEQFQKSLKTVTDMNLDGLVVIGGDDSNTNAMLLAEYFAKNGAKTKVIGVPKTIDGDLRNEFIETSFGFDTAVKVYSELITNLGYDAISAKRSYHFIRLMGRSASHITLEAALQTHPNLAIIGEEVKEKGLTLFDVTKDIADLIEERAALDKNYGIILIPEGLVEFMPDMNALISELNDLLAKLGSDCTEQQISEQLAPDSAKLFNSLPPIFRKQLMLDRDPHGNVQLSQMESERLIIGMVKNELEQRPGYTKRFFSISHFFGYEGRCALPTNFDCNYCYALGHTAAALLEAGRTGYVASVSNLLLPPEEWTCGGFPLTIMMNIERRKGKDSAVIKKALVELDKPAFQLFSKVRASWRLNEDYRCPGPIQHWGALAEETNFTLIANTTGKL